MNNQMHISEIDEMTHDELATAAARMAAANNDIDLAALAADLRETIDNELDSTQAASAIRAHLEGK